MNIKDIKTHISWEIYKPEWIQVTYVGLGYVEAIDRGNGTKYTFRTGDATMAGIEIPKDKSVFDYANELELNETQHGEVLDGPDTTEDSEKLT